MQSKDIKFVAFILWLPNTILIFYIALTSSVNPTEECHPNDTLTIRCDRSHSGTEGPARLSIAIFLTPLITDDINLLKGDQTSLFA